MSHVPTVDELVRAALEEGASLQEAPPTEKVAAISRESLDSMEETADALEKWASEAEKGDKEQEKTASDSKQKVQHNRILKLAMASTIMNTLQGLSDHGQLEQLIEKEARLKGLISGVERVRRRFSGLPGKLSKQEKVTAEALAKGRGLKKQLKTETAARGAAEQSTRKWQVAAGGAGAAGVAGAGLAYQSGTQAGATSERKKRARAMQRFSPYGR